MFSIIKKYNLNIIGIHQHLGSLFLNDKINDYINGVRRGLSIVNKYSEFNDVEIIDLGGGFGVPYICESGDIIAKNRKVNMPSVGDGIIVYNAGAYGYSMASNYTGRLRPAEVMVNENEDRLIRKRETIEYIESNIVW